MTNTNHFHSHISKKKKKKDVLQTRFDSGETDGQSECNRTRNSDNETHPDGSTVMHRVNQSTTNLCNWTRLPKP